MTIGIVIMIIPYGISAEVAFSFFRLSGINVNFLKFRVNIFVREHRSTTTGNTRIDLGKEQRGTDSLRYYHSS